MEACNLHFADFGGGGCWFVNNIRKRPTKYTMQNELPKLGLKLKYFLEPAMFCHLAVLLYLQRQGKRPKVHAKQKGFKNFFSGVIYGRKKYS